LKVHISNVAFGWSEIYQKSSYTHPSPAATTGFTDRNYALHGGTKLRSETSLTMGSICQNWRWINSLIVFVHHLMRMFADGAVKISRLLQFTDGAA
jgi:hypothetical protein